MPWILNEDAALKTKLSGITVEDINAPDSGRPVAVKYRDPEVEVSDMTFPAIVIEHAGISKADDREHRGLTLLPYAPEGVDEWADMDDPTKSPIKVEFPVPMNIDYQVTVYSRKQNHNMQIVAALSAWDRLPPRFGFLPLPQDGTIRLLDVMAGPDIQTGKDASNKRIIRSVYSLRVTSELFTSEIQAVQRAATVNLSLTLDLNHDVVAP